MRENPTRQMRQNLAVGERAIDTRTHGAEITLANLGMDRRASEFEIGQRNAVRGRREGHFAEELGADLVAEAARPAMMLTTMSPSARPNAAATPSSDTAVTSCTS